MNAEIGISNAEFDNFGMWNADCGICQFEMRNVELRNLAIRNGECRLRNYLGCPGLFSCARVRHATIAAFIYCLVNHILYTAAYLQARKLITHFRINAI